MDSPLLVKSKEFAIKIIKTCNIIKRKKHESVLTNQLIRSGTSIGVNIREAFYAHGKADFIAKLKIACGREGIYFISYPSKARIFCNLHRQNILQYIKEAKNT